MKYFLLAYLFTPSGDYLWKDVIPVHSQQECELKAAAYSKTIINTGNLVTFFCFNEDEYRSDTNQKYEEGLNPIDEHEPNE